MPQLREEYLRLHREVWPQVEHTLRACHITNYTIFILDTTLFAYYEYTGEDHEADMARIAADPTTQQWWVHTSPCQSVFNPDADPSATGWRQAAEVWHLGD